MTAVCGSDGQWTPNPGGVTCRPRPTQTFTHASTEAPTQAPMSTQTPTPTGRNEFLILLQAYAFNTHKHILPVTMYEFTTSITFRQTPVQLISSMHASIIRWYVNSSLTFTISITFQQTLVMKEAIPAPHVPPVLL